MNTTILANIVGCALAAIGVGVYASGLPIGDGKPSFGRFTAGLILATLGGVAIFGITGFQL